MSTLQGFVDRHEALRDKIQPVHYTANVYPVILN